jgi:hypothetical protein
LGRKQSAQSLALIGKSPQMPRGCMITPEYV